MRHRGAVCLLVVAVALIRLLAAGPHAALAKGAQPGTFTFRAHPFVPLLDQPDLEYPPALKAPDTQGLIDGPPETQAGAHADTSWTWVVTVPGGIEAVIEETEVPSDVVVDAPPGIYPNLRGVPACTAEQFANTVSEEHQDKGCPSASQVGVLSAHFGDTLVPRTFPIYKLTPAPGDAFTLAYPYELIFREPALIHGTLRSEGDYGVTLARTRSTLWTFTPAMFMTLWGVPADPIHDPERWDGKTQTWGAPLGGARTPLMTDASDCGGALESRLHISYRFEEDHFLPDNPADPAYRFTSPAPTGCELLSFEPRVEMATTTQAADAPSGFELGLEMPRNPVATSFEHPPLARAEIELPTGISLNPAAAAGRVGCDPAQIGLLEPQVLASRPIRFAAASPSCPAGSRVGSAVLDSTLFEGPLAGDVYLATPEDNPLQAPLGLYFVFETGEAARPEPVEEEPEEGEAGEGEAGEEDEAPRGPAVVIKLAAGVQVDPVTGRLSATIESVPQLPIQGLRLDLPDGPQAPLVTPPVCGEQVGVSRLLPWSAPASGPAARVRSELEFTAGPGGSRCREGRVARPFAPTLAVAGPTSAGESAPLTLRFGRPEGDQDLSGLSVTLPRGLGLAPAGVAVCDPAGIERAQRRSAPSGGVAERDDPSCPLAARVGSVRTELGAGPQPLIASGNVYLAGPDEGAPYSLVAITPALAGGIESDPLFDAGAVVERVPLRMDPRSGQVTASATALPATLAGVPLRIGTVELKLDRPGFVRAPTSCSEMRFTATAEGSEAGQAGLMHSFQVGGCAALAFAPSLRARLTRATKAGGRPGLRASLKLAPAGASMARAQLTLPATEQLSPAATPAPCDDTAPACARGRVVGKASARSPLLEQPLRGPVYLRAGAAGPELVLALGGPLSIEARGRLGLAAGRPWVSFSGLPDLALERLTVSLRGGAGGLLANRIDLCGQSARLAVRLTAHNGKVLSRRPRLASGCAGQGGGG